MRIGYWSSDVCSSDLVGGGDIIAPDGGRQHRGRQQRLPGHARPGGPVAPRDIAGEDRQIRLLGGGSGGSAGRAPRSDRVGDVGNARHIAVQRVADRKSTRLNSSHSCATRMPSSAWKKKKTTLVLKPH